MEPESATTPDGCQTSRVSLLPRQLTSRSVQGSTTVLHRPSCAARAETERKKESSVGDVCLSCSMGGCKLWMTDLVSVRKTT